MTVLEAVFDVFYFFNASSHFLRAAVTFFKLQAPHLGKFINI